MNTSNLSVPNQVKELPDVGTQLSIKTFNGSVFVVDQNGKLVDGQISVKAETSVDDITRVTLTFYSYDNEL